jgi:DNA repair/transcription protein MET18/MMS19
LFEGVSCYFPIAFTPQKDDPSAVTKTNLSEALHRVMSRSLFSSHCIPFLLDKLSSSIDDTKSDCLDVLHMVSAQYSSIELQAHAEDVLTALRNELVQDSPHPEKILTTTQVFAATMVGSITEPAAIYALFAPLIQVCLTACEPDVVNVAHSRAHAALLHHASLKSFAIADMLVRRMQPLLHSVYLESDLAPPFLASRQKECALLLLGGVLAGFEVHCSQRGKAICTGAPYNLTDATGILLDAMKCPPSPLSEAAAVEAAACCIAIGSHTSGAFPPAAITHELLVLTTNIHMHVEDETVSVTALKAIANVTRVSEILVASTVIPEWINGMVAQNATNTQRILFALCSTAKGGKLVFNAIAAFLLGRVETSAKVGGILLDTVLSIVNSLKEVVLHRGDMSLSQCAETAAAFQSLLRFLNLETVFVPDPVMEPLTTLLLTLFSSDLTSYRDVEGLGLLQIPEDVGSVSQMSMCVRCAAVAAHCTSLPADSIPTTTKRLMDLSIVPGIPLTLHNVIAQSLALVLNKCGGGSGTPLCPPQADHPRSISTIAYMTRGYLQRGDASNGDALADILYTTAATSESLSSAAVSGIATVLAPTLWLHPAQKAITKSIWSQRFHTLTLQRVLAYHHDGSMHVKSQMLCIVAHLTRLAKPEVLLNDAGVIVPLLLQAVSTFEDKATLDSCCEALVAVLPHVPDVFLANKEEIVTTMIAASHTPISMKVRAAALQLLQGLSQYKYEVVGMYRNKILAGTAICVDDSKRLVRTAAQQCRDVWYLFEAPPSNKK